MGNSLKTQIFSRKFGFTQYTNLHHEVTSMQYLHYILIIQSKMMNNSIFEWRAAANNSRLQRNLHLDEFSLLFQIKLCDIEEVDLLDRRGYLVISITLSSRGEGKIYLRKTEGIRDWFNSLKVSTYIPTYLISFCFSDGKKYQKCILYPKFELQRGLQNNEKIFEKHCFQPFEVVP